MTHRHGNGGLWAKGHLALPAASNKHTHTNMSEEATHVPPHC